MEDLIRKKLNMSVEEFEQIDLSKINIDTEKLKLYINKNIYDTTEYLYFYFACVFIAQYLNKNDHVKSHIKSIHPEFIRNIKQVDDAKAYENDGYNKFITLKLINFNQNLLNKMPKKLLNIPIIIVPLYNKIIKLPFQLGKIKLDNNELNISEENNNDLLSRVYSLFIKKKEEYIVSYSGNSNENHEIIVDGHKIIYKVIEPNKISFLPNNFKKEIRVKKRNFDYIIYEKAYE